VKCERCGGEISNDESCQHLSQTLCEDCYIDLKYPAKTCDPWAVYSATRTRNSAGQTGAAGLTDLQQALYDFVKGNSKVTREDLMRNFNLSETEVQTQIAVLRHCELVRGQKEGSNVYLVPFS